MKLGNVLVVDDSRLMRELVSVLLAPHATQVLTAADCQEALDLIDSQRAIDLVICDVVLPDGDGFEVLERVAGGPTPRPALILITSRWDEAGAERAAALGALGYLSKPISLRDLRICVAREPDPREELRPELRRRTLAKVWLVDGENRQDYLLCWDVHDVSVSGALLETAGPLPVGAELELELLLGELSLRTRARVVRVQQPSWLKVGGVGVRFEGLDDAARASLQAFVRDTDPVRVDASYYGWSPSRSRPGSESGE